jgi:hypothetical protein
MITDIQIFITCVNAIAIPFLYYVWVKKKNIETHDKVLVTLIITPMISVFGAFIILFNLRFLESNSTESYKPTCYIASIKNSDEIRGNFTLGCGTIKETEYYYYFYKTLNGGYARGKKDVNRTVIVEDGSQQPHIEVLTTSYESKSGWFKYNDQSEEEYKIIVPKGTIVSKFELY